LSSPGIFYNQDFDVDWLEVATHCPDEQQDMSANVSFLDDELPEPCCYDLPIVHDVDSRGSQVHYGGLLVLFPLYLVLDSFSLLFSNIWS
jgi:hypothetical protein